MVLIDKSCPLFFFWLDVDKKLSHGPIWAFSARSLRPGPIKQAHWAVLLSDPTGNGAHGQV